MPRGMGADILENFGVLLGERERKRKIERGRESAAFFGRSANCARRRLGMLLPQREDDATRSIMSHESHAPTLAASKGGERGGVVRIGVAKNQ